jgi:hypothetical protein
MEIQSTTAKLNPATADVEQIVKSRLNGRVMAFRLVMMGQGLVLRGQCMTYHAKQVAQHIVMEVSTLRILANDIEVLKGDEP